MLVKNRQTNEIVELTVIDPNTGNDYTADLIGNFDGFSAEMFASAEDTDADYIADTTTIEWWKEALQGEQECVDLKAEFIAEFGSAALDELLDGIDDAEFWEYNLAVVPLLKEKLS